jgi:hypothetical protein
MFVDPSARFIANEPRRFSSEWWTDTSPAMRSLHFGWLRVRFASATPI